MCTSDGYPGPPISDSALLGRMLNAQGGSDAWPRGTVSADDDLKWRCNESTRLCECEPSCTGPQRPSDNCKTICEIESSMARSSGDWRRAQVHLFMPIWAKHVTLIQQTSIQSNHETKHASLKIIFPYPHTSNQTMARASIRLVHARAVACKIAWNPLCHMVA